MGGPGERPPQGVNKEVSVFNQETGVCDQREREREGEGGRERERERESAKGVACFFALLYSYFVLGRISWSPVSHGVKPALALQMGP